MHGGAAVTQHEHELGVREHCFDVARVAQHKRILVAHVFGGFSVAHNHLENERANSRVDDVVGDASALQTLALFFRVAPLS